MGTPDSLRLSRLDKLIADLGEHSLNIRQQVSCCCAMRSVAMTAC